MYHLLCSSFILLALATTSFAVTEILTIPTRPGVPLEFLVMTPEKGAHHDALILFPGGNGAGP